MHYNLNEATLNQKLSQLTHNKYSPHQLSQLLRFSPNFKQEWLVARISFDFKENDIQCEDAKKVFTQNGFEVKSSNNSQTNYITSFKIVGKLQGMVMKNLVSRIPKNTKIQFKNGMMTIVGPLEVNKIAFKTAKAIESKADVQATIDSPDLDQDFKDCTNEVQHTSLSYMMEVVGDLDQATSLIDENELGSFVASMSLASNDSVVDPKTLEIVQFLDKQIANSNEFEQVIAYARKCKLAQLLNMTKNSSTKPLSELATTDDLCKYCMSLFDVNVDESFPDYKAVKNPLARRRMKLFEDLKFYGGKVYSNAGWMCGICYTMEQNHIFGRYKPAVDENGDIVELANKRDDELQALVDKNELTPEQAQQYKTLRDSPDAKRITNGEYNPRKSETYWCTTYARSGEYTWTIDSEKLKSNNFWYNYNWKLKERDKTHDEIGMDVRNPYWVFMNLSNGVLFQYSRFVEGSRLRDYMMDEDDRTTDGTNSTCHGEQGLLSHLMGLFPDLKALALELSPLKAEAKDYIGKMKFDDDGALVIEKNGTSISDDVKEYLKSPIGPNKIRIMVKDGTSLFDQIQLPSVTTIDMTYVENASRMFRHSHLNRSLTIIGSQNCKNMSYMFSGAEGLVEIKGLDTKNSTDCSGMFLNCKTKNDLELRIAGTFNLQNCTSVQDMFKNSPISQVRIDKLDNVTSALDIITNCSRLSNIPNLMFPQILNVKNVFPDMDLEDSISMFSTNTQIVESTDPRELYAACDKILSFYQEDVQERLTTFIDANGYLVVNSTQMLRDLTRGQLNRFRKIRIGFSIEDSSSYSITNWWGSKPVLVDEISVEGIENANFLFYGADLRLVKRIVGTHGIKNAVGLFSHCKFPKHDVGVLDFSSAQKIKHMFNNATFQYLPQLKFGTNVTTPIDNSSTVADGCYLSGLQHDEMVHAIDQWVQKMFTDQIMEDLLRKVFDSHTGTLKLTAEGSDLLAPKNFPQAEDGSFTFYGNAINSIEVVREAGVKAFKQLFPQRYIESNQSWSYYKNKLKAMKIPDVKLIDVADASYMFNGGENGARQAYYESIGKITGLGSAINTYAMFKSISVKNGGIVVDDGRSIVVGQYMFYDVRILSNGQDAYIDIPLDFPNIDDAKNMFYRTRIKGGPLHLNRNARTIARMFNLANAITSPLDIGEFAYDGESSEGTFQTSTAKLKAKSIEVSSSSTAKQMFDGVQFVDSDVIAYVKLHTPDGYRFMHNVRGIVQIGTLEADDSCDEAFDMSDDLKSICFIDVDPEKVRLYTFSKQTMASYGCDSAKDMRNVLRAMRELQA